MIKILIIDDARPPEFFNEVNYTMTRNYQDGMYALQYMGPWDLLYLDHDLGTLEHTGYDIAKFLEQNTHFLPKKVVCVSSNPVGKRNIEQAIKNAHKFKQIDFGSKVIC